MILKIFSVKDLATGMFGTPMFLISVGQATRSFGDEVNRSGSDNQLFAHPEDFELYELGEFDTDQAMFVCFPAQLVIRGKDMRVVQ